MDFAYLEKPIIYCQFDADRFFAGEHTRQKGYYDYERDGFGEVERTVDGTVDRIIEYLSRDCRIKDVYRERIEAFFAFRDADHSKRVVEYMLKME